MDILYINVPHILQAAKGAIMISSEHLKEKLCQ